VAYRDAEMQIRHCRTVTNSLPGPSRYSLAVRAKRSGEVVSRTGLEAFIYHGEQIHLIDKSRGIRNRPTGYCATPTAPATRDDMTKAAVCRRRC
jgi:hypothetical protein